MTVDILYELNYRSRDKDDGIYGANMVEYIDMSQQIKKWIHR